MNSLEIEILVRGKPVKGRYNVSDSLVTVAAWSGTKTIEDGMILDFTVSDEALEHAAADTIFSLGNCTDARVCRVPNERRVTR